MSNRPEPTQTPADPGKEALARARAARAVLREQKEAKERTVKEQQMRRRLFFKRTARRTCMVYMTLNVLYFFVYLAVIYPIKDQPFSDMIRGGTSIIGHAVFFAASLLTAAVYSLILYKQQEKKPHPIPDYLSRSSFWFTIVMAVCISAHGIYLDMLYNQYAVTQANIFLGPSFLLTFGALLFALCLPTVNRLYQVERMPLAIRAILHFFCLVILISICFQVIAHGFAASADLLIFLVIFAVFYAFISIFSIVTKSAIRREENDAEEYTSMFKKTPGKATAAEPDENTK